MPNITPPKAQVPVGRVTINGQVIDVQQHPEFVRFFFDLFRRVGGTESDNAGDVQSLTDANRLGVFQPRQPPKEPADIQFVNAFARRTVQQGQDLSIPNIAAFMPRIQQQSTPLAESNSVICSRVFRQR